MLNVSLKNKIQLFSTNLNLGQGLIIFENDYSRSYREIDFSYGRELKPVKWFAIEGFAGLGYLSLSGERPNYPKINTITVPLRVYMKFIIINGFGIGYNGNYSINSLSNTFSTNFGIFYNF